MRSRSQNTLSILMVASAIAISLLITIPARSAPVFPSATPESQGISSEALDALAAVVDGYLEDDMIVGAELLVIKNRRTVLHRTFGLRDREDDLAWAPHTICNVRSMTKPLTGAAAQILIDRGQLALDDPVAKFIPAFDTDEARMITVRHLLTHRSGLPLTVFKVSADEYEDLAAIAAATGSGGPQFEPDSKFWYSDAGSDTLAAVVAEVSGVPIDEFVTTEILKPLGMGDSGYIRSADDPRFERLASLYIGSPNNWTQYWEPEDKTIYPFAWGSQTLFSTPMDYAKFLAMWMDRGQVNGKQTLSYEAIKRTLTPVSEMSMLGSDERFPTGFADLEVYYGQMSVLHLPKGKGLNAEPVIIGHSGSDGTIAWAWPEDDLMILYFTQSRGGTSALRIEENIDQLILHPDREIVEETVPAEFQPYLGTYIANFAQHKDEEFVVRMHDGKLALDVPSQMVFDLDGPDDTGKWTFAMVPAIGVTFEKDADGKVNLLKIHQPPFVFEVPREGTKLAEDMAELPTVDPEAVGNILGHYTDPEVNQDREICLEGNVLCIKAPPNAVFHLAPTDDPHRYDIKELPGISLSFQFNDKGEAISMTRHIQDSALVMARNFDWTDEPDTEDEDDSDR